MQMDNQQQELFSDLLARNTEGQLNQQEVTQLNEIMQVYRRGLVRKGRAIKVAVERGLIPSLN